MMKYFALSVSILILLAGSSVESKAASCPGQCEPNGQCINGECVCNDGYAGADCSFPFVNCPDDKTMCFDGAQCQRIAMKEEHNKREEGYICDCQHLSGASQFQIDECENPDSQVCEVGQSSSLYAFCTNGGKCKEMIHNGAPHAGCICTDDFEGRHCQYRKGTAPESELQAAYVEERSHVAGGIAFLIALIVFTVVGGIIGYKFYMDRQQRKLAEMDITKVETTLNDLEVTNSIDSEDVTPFDGTGGGDDSNTDALDALKKTISAESDGILEVEGSPSALDGNMC